MLCLYAVQISGERLHDHWSSGFKTLGVIPSSPVALATSSDPMIERRSVFFIKGIVNLILSGTFEFS